MKFEIYKDKRREWRFRLKADNGKVVTVGESYQSKQGVKKGINLIIKACGSVRPPKIVEVKK